MIKPSNKKTKRSNIFCKITVSKDVPSYANEPYFIEKGEKARKFIEKVGLPKELLKIQDERKASRKVSQQLRKRKK